MHESITLFDEVVNARWFSNSAIILFLNKCDLFEEKIKKIDMKCMFDDYEGNNFSLLFSSPPIPKTHPSSLTPFLPPSSLTSHLSPLSSLFSISPFPPSPGGNDYKAGCEFLTNVFVDLVEHPEGHRREVFPHVTCATDTMNVKFVFDSVRKAILQGTLGEIFA